MKIITVLVTFGYEKFMCYLTKITDWKIDKRYNIDKLLYLLSDRPDKINYRGDVIWKNNKNLCHRDYNLPALIWNKMGIFWFYKSGKLLDNNF